MVKRILVAILVLLLCTPNVFACGGGNIFSGGNGKIMSATGGGSLHPGFMSGANAWKKHKMHRHGGGMWGGRGGSWGNQDSSGLGNVSDVMGKISSAINDFKGSVSGEGMTSELLQSALSKFSDAIKNITSELSLGNKDNDEAVADDAADDEVVADDAADDEVVADDAADDEVVADDAADDEVVADDADDDEVVADDADDDEVVADDAADDDTADAAESDKADATGFQGVLTSMIGLMESFVDALKTMFETFMGSWSGKGSELPKVTVSDAAKEDGNVRAAKVVERGDSVYGVVKYGKPNSDSATGPENDGSFWGGHHRGWGWGRGRHNFGKNSKVEFTGIAADDIKSVSLDSASDGKLQFTVTKTDDTTATFDVPERKKHGHKGDDDDTPPADPGDDDDDTPPVDPGDDDDTPPVDPGDDTTPPDFTDYTDSESLVAEAWDLFNDKNYGDAKAFADELITRYTADAVDQQDSLSGFADEDDAADYWALNDVATAHFILGKIAVAQNDDDEAIEQFQKIIDDYKYAQCWDTQGWFWKVAEGAQEELDKLD